MDDVLEIFVGVGEFVDDLGVMMVTALEMLSI